MGSGETGAAQGAGLDRQLGDQTGEASTARLGHHTQAGTTRLPGGLKQKKNANKNRL